MSNWSRGPYVPVGCVVNSYNISRWNERPSRAVQVGPVIE